MFILCDDLFLKLHVQQHEEDNRRLKLTNFNQVDPKNRRFSFIAFNLSGHRCDDIHIDLFFSTTLAVSENPPICYEDEIKEQSAFKDQTITFQSEIAGRYKSRLHHHMLYLEDRPRYAHNPINIEVDVITAMQTMYLKTDWSILVNEYVEDESESDSDVDQEESEIDSSGSESDSEEDRVRILMGKFDCLRHTLIFW